MVWKGFNWMLREPWGFMHPQKPEFWYDEGAVFVNEYGHLMLKTRRNPLISEGQMLSPTGAGLVCCNQGFHFGYYSFVVDLPVGKNLWPAIWMYDMNTWPPEIDLLEAYTNRWSKYRILPWQPFKAETCLHWTDEKGKKRMMRKKSGWIRKRTDVVVELAWTAARIIVWHNYRKVMEISDREVMQHFQKPMRLILNNGVRTKRKANPNEETCFVIKNFTYLKM
ncbi:MAG: family 16 glycosylhydrolase [Firmicutes bacterium]|jgi:hypothetical protein|nr:family 16 glycosylhydrolase [Bacillota bacterium]